MTEETEKDFVEENEEGYIPPQTIERAPKVNVVEGNKKLFRVVVVVFGLTLGGVLVNGIFEDEKRGAEQKKEAVNKPAYSGDIIPDLPQSYSDVKQDVPKLGEKVQGEFGALGIPAEQRNAKLSQPMEESEADKIRKEIEAERLKAEMEARHAKVNFTGSTNTASGYTAPGGIPEGAAGQGNTGGLVKAAGTARDDSNRQDDKTEFLERNRSSNPYLSEAIITPNSPYLLSAGTIIPGVMISGINSDLPGYITGMVTQRVYDTKIGKYELIPQGTKILGVYNSTVTYGQSRVQVVWTRLIFPDATSISLDGMAGVDLSGKAGLTDQVNNHWGKLFTGAILSSILGAGAQVAQGSSSNQLNPGFAQLATQGFSQNANQIGQQITEKNLQVQPTLEIREGYRFNILVQKDMELKPFITN